MKIVALQSSPRQGGNTEQIVRLIEESLRRLTAQKSETLDYEYIALADLNLGLCRGCRVCFDRGEAKCPLKDGLPAVHAKLLDADGVIFASPVFVEDVTASMKNFIDRMAFNCHRPAFAGKTALIITTSGSGSSNHAVRTLRYALGSWGFHLAGYEKFRMGARMDRTAAAERFGRKAERAAVKLADAVLGKKAFHPSFLSLMMFKIQQTIYRTSPKFRDTYDRDWWSQRGWLDKKCRFYIPHRPNPLKLLPARALGAVMSKMFG